MKKLIFLLFCVITVHSFAQKNEDVLVEPQPHLLKQYHPNVSSSGKKTVYTIVKKQGFNSINDTMQVDFYNGQGFKVKTVRYENNQPESSLEFRYDENGNEVETKYEKRSLQNVTSFTESTYNSQNRLIQIQSKTKRLDDITISNTKKYNYKDDQLIEKKIYQGKNNSQIDSFFYHNKLLTHHKLIYTQAIYAFENNYAYNHTGQLILKETRNIIKDKSTKELSGKTEYTYEKGNLVAVIELEGKNLTNQEPVRTFYSYDADDQLSKMRVEYKSFYRDVKYEYEDAKISSIQVISNSDNNAYLKFWVATFGNMISEFPFQYEEKFTYDDKANLISKKILLNDELIREIVYHIEYY